MITFLSYIMFVLSLLYTSFYPAIIIAKASRRKSSEHKSGSGVDKSLSLVVPSKGEPLDLVLDRLGRLSNMKCYDDIVVVLDDDIEYVYKLIELTEDNFFAMGGIVVARFNGFGGRNGALNDGARIAWGKNIVVLDIDTIPTEDFLCNARRCAEVCVGVWRPYIETYTRVEEGMWYVTRFGSWVLYELRSKLNLFIYPLGSGTVIDRRLLESIGFWRTDVIQDDIWLGYELMGRGIKPRLIDGYIDIGVPRTLEGVRIQQCRWSYGSSNTVSRFLSRAIKSPLRLREKVEAVMYSAQPVASLLALTSFILALVASIVDKSVRLHALHVLPVLAILVVQGLALNTYGRTVHRLGKWKRICLSGRTGAMYTLLAPLLGYYALKGLIRARYRYRITPKSTKFNRKPVDISEIVSVVLSLPTAIFSIINGNGVTLFISSTLAMATLYSLIRLEKGVSA